MKRVMLYIFLSFVFSWAIPKPMESIENYNVIMIHGAYGSNKGIENCSDSYAIEAAFATKYFSTSEKAANIGYYNESGRLTYWLDSLVFEDYSYDSMGNPYIDDEYLNASPYIYSWRAFTNPANSSINNAHELGDRKWNDCGKRRALVEEVQEIKSSFFDSVEKKFIYGQIALDSIRNYPDLYRQLPSRYILIGHSMGGVVAREYVQNSDYYHGDVDKVITLDSPHKGYRFKNGQNTSGSKRSKSKCNRYFKTNGRASRL